MAETRATKRRERFGASFGGRRGDDGGGGGFAHARVEGTVPVAARGGRDKREAAAGVGVRPKVGDGVTRGVDVVDERIRAESKASAGAAKGPTRSRNT